ncbi:glycerate kinase [Gordonia sp. LUNF6]|uniref:glycerate kinase family protein n=1 Tax=Gordonia sp. LUNF6 TaxID=3388658 RepID=UPI00399A2680
MDTTAMRVVIAPDEFGGTLTAAQAASAIAEGWARARPGDVLEQLPQSDGGPGFVDVLAAAGVGRRLGVSASGPLGGAVAAEVLLDGRTAFVESAQACGLHLIGSPGPETAWCAGTAGVGDLLRAAVEAGATRIVVGLGGSGTTDGGRGACTALGGLTAAHHLLRGTELVAATDVTNPLLGPSGAAAVFAPQKGADPETVARLESRLQRWADELEDHRVGTDNGQRLRDAAGAGAAGGLGAFLLALGATREAGADVVAGVTGRPRRIAGADLVLTGEGRFDEQTPFGKVVASVAADARRAGVPAVVLAGQVRGRPRVDGVTVAYSMADWAGSSARALADPAPILAGLAQTVAAGFAGTVERTGI